MWPCLTSAAAQPCQRQGIPWAEMRGELPPAVLLRSGSGFASPRSSLGAQEGDCKEEVALRGSCPHPAKRGPSLPAAPLPKHPLTEAKLLCPSRAFLWAEAESSSPWEPALLLWVFSSLTVLPSALCFLVCMLVCNALFLLRFSLYG